MEITNAKSINDVSKTLKTKLKEIIRKTKPMSFDQRTQKLKEVHLDHAYQWSRSRKVGWAIAQSPILNTTITVANLTQRGYESLLTYYVKVSSQLQSSPLFPIV